MTRLKAAIVGAGGIANAHIQALKKLPEQVEVVAAVDIDAARLAAFADQHQIAGRYTDIESMLKSEHPNIVHICTPPFNHTELAIAALEGGAWVLCEKPLCGSLAELARI